MRKTTGYKGMLRDRIPKLVDYALKWQKAKEQWINHAYDNFIKLYIANNERKIATRIVLGISKYYRNFSFHKSIDWENLTDNETIYWKRVEGWVTWFETRYAYMKNAYEISRKIGKSDEDIKIEIISKYLHTLLPQNNEEESIKEAKYKYVDNLIDYLFKCFESDQK